MNEFCNVGLHSFGEWQSKPRRLTQTRNCRNCPVVQQRDWEPDIEARRPYDPYLDLRR